MSQACSKPEPAVGEEVPQRLLQRHAVERDGADVLEPDGLPVLPPVDVRLAQEVSDAEGVEVLLVDAQEVGDVPRRVGDEVGRHEEMHGLLESLGAVQLEGLRDDLLGAVPELLAVLEAARLSVPPAVRPRAVRTSGLRH